MSWTRFLRSVFTLGRQPDASPSPGLDGPNTTAISEAVNLPQLQR